MDWRGQRPSDNIEDRRGGGGGGGGFGGGPQFPIGRGGGGLGIGGIVVVLVIAWAVGINPLSLLDGSFGNGGGFDSGSGGFSTPAGQTGTPSDDQGRFVAAVVGSTEDVWTAIFKQSGKQYAPPTLVLFSGQTPSSCGLASAAVGPFYCPQDRKVYLDLRFFDELSRRFGAPGDFAEAYVIAHEVGHHVQRLLGALGTQGAGSNDQSVRTELQADCYAGVWAYAADKAGLVQVGDINEALNAASQIGDDTLQRKEQGTVVPDSFTHGTSAQRSGWFKRGYQSGKISDCDTFSARPL